MDLTKDRKKLMELYRPDTDQFTLVDVPELPFAMLDGTGTPDDGAPAAAIKCLYTAIYTIRREARARMGKAFVEPPVEMLYWADDMADLVSGNKDKWKWRVMIPLPAWTDSELFARSVAEAEKQLGKPLGGLRMELFEEGCCAQIMHVGQACDIPGLLKELYTEFLPRNGLKPSGAYHEIYLDDWSRTAPEQRKLILRQPVRRQD